MDIVLLVEKFLSLHESDRDYEYDNYSHNGESITRWDFKNIPQPTMEELEALQENVQAKLNQDAINKEALEYLASTDWMIIRELDSGIACPADVKAARAEARAKVVK